jgi:uncharacterized protein (TIGR02217 family)
MYLDAYLAPCPGYGWEGGPEFNTRIVSLANGRERRNANWSQPRHKYAAPYLNISKDAYREIKRMFYVCQGMLNAFRFRDQLDYEAVDQQFGVGDGTTDTFQLVTVSVADGVPYGRNVTALAENPTVEIDGTPTALFTADLDRGLIVFNSPPGVGEVLTWSGIFDIWVRFNQDYLPFSLDNPNATNGGVEVIEVPPPELVTS